MIMVENRGDTFAYSVKGEDDVLLREAAEAAAVAIAAVMGERGRFAPRDGMQRHTAVLRLADAIAGDAAALAEELLKGGGLQEDGESGVPDRETPEADAPGGAAQDGGQAGQA